jgi:RimJ/RimL family protein N-acetyltransferase
MTCPHPPERIRTPRLLLRCYQSEDAPLLKEAIDSSLAHLRAWMPWAMAEPSELSVLEARLERFRAEFTAGLDFTFGIFEPTERSLLGGIGLHPRLGPGALEIGYWMRASATGQGYATEAARALTQVALALPGIARVEIRCDPANARSAAIPRRLGYRHVETLVRDTLTPEGQPRDTMVWILTAAERGMPKHPLAELQ